MKIYLSMISLCLVSFHILSQNSLSGYITDQPTHEALSGAHIYIPDLRKGAVTNLDGFFEIRDLPQGTFLVQVSYLSYAAQVHKTMISGATTLDLALVPSITEMSEIVVTGTSASTRRELNPIPTIVIHNLSSGGLSSNIVDAISSQPGIAQITTGGAISKPVIRGLGYNRVVVLNNQIRQEGQQWGDEHGIEIDEYSVGQVEIIKGPGSLMYGSDAMAGVVHFHAPKPVAEGNIIGNVMANYQANNNLIGYSLMNAGNLKGIDWLARISSKTAGNYQNRYDGKVYNSGFNEFNTNASLGINRRWGYAHLDFSNFNQSLGLVEGERDGMGNFIRSVVVNDTTLEERAVTGSDLNGYDIGVPRQDIGHLKIAGISKFILRNSILSLIIGFQQNSRKEFADPFNPNAEELDFLLNTLNYDARYLLPETRGWQTSVGLNGMGQRSENRGEEYLIPEYGLFDIGVFAFTQKSFERVHVSGGLRYDLRRVNIDPLYLDEEGSPTDPPGDVKFSAFSTTFSNVSASVGASYQMSRRSTAKLNISRGFRSPNMAELSSNGIHEGTFRYELGNSDLTPETSLQLDAGLLYNSDHVSIELAAFNNAISNYIYLQQLKSVSGGDSIIDPSEPVPVFQFVQSNANLYGGEFVIDLHPHPLDWLHFQNVFSIVRGRQRDQPDSTRYLPFIPAPRIQTELKANFNKVGSWLRNLYVSLDAVYTFQQSEVLSAFGTETPTPAYTLVNAGLGADIINRAGRMLCSLSISAANLGDVGYQSHLSRLKYAPENPGTRRTGVYNMGRNISLRISVPLSFKSGT